MSDDSEPEIEETQLKWDFFFFLESLLFFGYQLNKFE